MSIRRDDRIRNIIDLTVNYLTGYTRGRAFGFYGQQLRLKVIIFFCLCFNRDLILLPMFNGRLSHRREITETTIVTIRLLSYRVYTYMCVCVRVNSLKN